MEVCRRMRVDVQAQFTAIAPYYDHLMRHVPYESWANYVEELVRREMGAAAALSVPLEVSVGYGRSWDDAAH